MICLNTLKKCLILSKLQHEFPSPLLLPPPVFCAELWAKMFGQKKKYIENTLLATPEISYSNVLAGFYMLKASDENITKNEEH